MKDIGFIFRLHLYIYRFYEGIVYGEYSFKVSADLGFSIHIYIHIIYIWYRRTLASTSISLAWNPVCNFIYGLQACCS